MTDSRTLYDEDRLPWLEAVDDEDGPRGLSARKMLVAVVMVVIAIAIVAGTMFWLGRRNSDSFHGAPELIKADPTPYKIKPSDPGGLDVAGDSGTAYATSAGDDTDAQIDMGKADVPPPPVAAAPEAAKPKPVEKPIVKPEADSTPAPAPAGAKGSIVQLGAYNSAAKAETAWSMLSGRFAPVASLRKMVVTATVGGHTVYRLRAAGGSPADARAACAALAAGGENCLVVN